MSESKNKMKKVRVGEVVSNKMQKTVAVLVARRFLDPHFKKYVSRKKKFLAHDEKQQCRLGDWVQIEETRPLSRRKSWKVTAVLKKGSGEIAL